MRAMGGRAKERDSVNTLDQQSANHPVGEDERYPQKVFLGEYSEDNFDSMPFLYTTYYCNIY